MSKPTVNKQFIVNLQGKEFVTYEGLLDLAHQTGLKSIETEILQLPTDENGNTCIVKAVCKTDDAEFHGIGDAAPNSVNRMILPHAIRMAETRAKARALRDLTNIGMTAVEELGGDSKGSAVDDPITDKQLSYMVSLAQEKNMISDMPNLIKDKFNKNKSEELTKVEANELINYLKEEV